MAFATKAFVYEWTDHYNGMFYIGYHKGSPDDGYIGSGKMFRKAYDSNPDLFTREIIAYGTMKEMKKLEKKLLKENNAAFNPRSYNLTNHSRGGHKHTAETKAKMGALKLGKPINRTKPAHNKGKPHSPEQIEKFLASRTYNKYTEEEKLVHSERMKLWWAERKAKNVRN